MQGVTVAEQIRTFNGRLFRLDEHLDRFQESLEIVGIESHDIREAAIGLASHNHALLEPGADLGLCIFATPGPYLTMATAAGEDAGPRLVMHTYAIPFHQWAEKFDTGQKLVVSQIRQVPQNCWPASLKCRSRMHYFLADREARKVDPNSRALLLDQDGFVAEASTANILAYFKGEGLVSPLQEKILPGISVAVTIDIAKAAGIPVVHRDITPDELKSADEIMLCSTSVCMLPVSSVNGSAIGRQMPGNVYLQLMDAWNDLVGLNVKQQALDFCNLRSI
jgi:branched-subunit amino acid aminotransferase/4-amino-4-deoxychorismate lyase